MKIATQKTTLAVIGGLLLCLLLAHFSDAATIDPETVEVALLFDEGGGNTARDSSANGRDADIDGAKFVKGQFGDALEYDGVDDNVIITDYFGVGGTDPRTTVFWVQTKDTREHSWIKWGPNNPGEKYYIRAHLRGAECNLRVEVNGGQNYGSTNVCDGEWHHCAVVFPEGSDSVQDHELYVDGELETKEGGDQAMNTNDKDQEVNMGDFLAHHAFAFGLLDEVAIFSVDLTEDQIQTIMNDGLAAALSVELTHKLTTTWGRIKSSK